METQTSKLISSLCYFSIFFAGFILPIAVYFIVNEREVKNHAKSALLSHIIPVLTLPILFVIAMVGMVDAHIWLFIAFFVIFGLVNIAVVIWNVVKGIKVFTE